MASIDSHIRQLDNHEELPFRADCPLCVSRLAGEAPSERLLSARTQAGIAAGAVMAGTLVPSGQALAAGAGASLGSVIQGSGQGQSAGSIQERVGGRQQSDAVKRQKPSGTMTTHGRRMIRQAAPPAGPAAPPAGQAVPPPPAAVVAAPEPSSPPQSDPAPSGNAAPEARAADSAPPLRPLASVAAPTRSSAPAAPKPSAAPQQPQRSKSASPPRRKLLADDSGGRDSSASRPEATTERAPLLAQEGHGVAGDSVAAKGKGATGGQGARGGTHTVKSGECLWHIAEAQLGSGASGAEVARYVQQLWNENAERIGTGDPNLILPGQQLQM